MKPVIAITEKEYYKAQTIFQSANDIECIPGPLEEQALAKMLSERSAFGCILGVESYTDQLYRSLPTGGIIARFGVGHDGVDKQKASENGLLVTNTPGVLDDSVAEHAVFLMGALLRNIARHDRELKDHRWLPEIGTGIKGKTLLILGCGPIGREVARIASFGLLMNVVGVDISPGLDADQLKKDYGIARLVKDYHGLLEQADIVSIHLPSLSSTRHLVNAAFLCKLKNSAYLINTSRGPIVDETAIYDALENKTLAGAALDVFEHEPFEPIDPKKDLRTFSNVILTPHVGSSTVEACQRMASRCLDNITAAINKDFDRLDILNPQVLAQLQ